MLLGHMCYFHCIEYICIFVGKSWRNEATNTGCPNNELIRPVASQVHCQSLCQEKSKSSGGGGCVGITYSHKIGPNAYCYLCNDDKTGSAGNGLGFYRRPGTV